MAPAPLWGGHVLGLDPHLLARQLERITRRPALWELLHADGAPTA